MNQEERLENIELKSDGFENFEEQNKYKSVTLKQKKRADFCGKMSVIMLLLGIFVWRLDVDVISKYIDDSMPHRADYMLIGFGLVAGIFAFIGFLNKKTELTKGILLLLVLLPIALSLGMMVGLGMLYALFFPFVEMARSGMG